MWQICIIIVSIINIAILNFVLSNFFFLLKSQHRHYYCDYDYEYEYHYHYYNSNLMVMMLVMFLLQLSLLFYLRSKNNTSFCCCPSIFFFFLLLWNQLKLYDNYKLIYQLWQYYCCFYCYHWRYCVYFFAAIVITLYLLPSFWYHYSIQLIFVWNYSTINPERYTMCYF